jgi:lipopolysaccharide biosynthesis protein
MDLLQQIDRNVAPGPYFEEDRDDLTFHRRPPVRLVAYYLPQFHPIPENDLWWGKGFTEWTNVTRALPRFVGHHQPQLPDGLGFYDLRVPETLAQQASLARRHGIEGFCFHYYWFNGRELLDTPLKLLLSHRNIDLPFCINWANDHWTRAWDSAESRILIRQEHSPESDIAFAATLEPVLRDPRYIRIGGRPLLMVYNPGLLPDPGATAARWRRHFIECGVGDPYLVASHRAEQSDPRLLGMDAIAGFPPHRFGFGLPSIAERLEFLSPRFSGRVHSYDSMAERAMAFRAEGYKYFQGVCPGWDNEARRPGKGLIFQGSTPEKYGRWLDDACEKAMQARDDDERIVFVNAWNEWAEGAHLEPDRHYGYAYLRETARALGRVRITPRESFGADLGGFQNGPISPPEPPEAPGPWARALRWYTRKLRTKCAVFVEDLAEAIRP